MGEQPTYEKTPLEEQLYEKTKKTPKKPRLGSGKRNRNECLTWLREYAKEKRREQEAQREKAELQHPEKTELFSGMLNVLKDLKNELKYFVD